MILASVRIGRWFKIIILEGLKNMALGKKRREDDESQIDLTPMLDVVFIMLIFFIVTATFVNEQGLDVNRPPPAPDIPPPPDVKKNAVFEITETSEVYLIEDERRRIDVRAVRANVERIRAENPEASVVVQASPKAKTEVFVKISDQAREAGVYNISLLTKDKKR